MTATLATLFFAQGLLVDTAALGAVALVGYLFGRRSRRPAPATSDVSLLIELARGQAAANELEHVVQRVRTEAAAYMRNLAAFQGQVSLMQRGETVAGWQKLRDLADALMAPTLRLTTTLSLSCDELRQQQAQLVAYAGTRVDPATGLRNRRAMTEHLQALLSAHTEGERRVALGLFSMPLDSDNAKETEAQLKEAARLLERSVRSNDIVARYSQDEFAVLLPKTDLAGILMLGERLVRLIGVELERPVWGGLVEAMPGESPEKLFLRADSALYSARTHDEAALYQHNGSTVRRHAFEIKTSESALSGEADLVAALA
jgi:diguanylate cyclase (GGDEF)-like protein